MHICRAQCAPLSCCSCSPAADDSTKIARLLYSDDTCIVRDVVDAELNMKIPVQ